VYWPTGHGANTMQYYSPLRAQFGVIWRARQTTDREEIPMPSAFGVVPDPGHTQHQQLRNQGNFLSVKARETVSKRDTFA
jgi:hypothetical protein